MTRETTGGRTEARREAGSMATTADGFGYVDATGLEDGGRTELDRVVGSVSRTLANWVQTTRGAARPSIFNRAAYAAPNSPYEIMRTAKNAVDYDDIVGGVADVTEGLILQGLKWESEDADEADVFNQIATDLDLDQFARQWHREEFTYSQAVVGVWWGRKSYTVRGRTEQGKKKKKRKDLYCPIALTYLDPTKVVPLLPGPFGQDRLAWHATEEEYSAVLAGPEGSYVEDPVLRQFTTGAITGLSKTEESYLSEIGISPGRLLGLNPAQVFRFCRTKASYERFPTNRLLGTFATLDLKQQLLEADRVALVSAINFILLVKQGTKEQPALPEEIRNLKDNFSVVAKLPVIIGDHRLAIEIITPNQEHTVEASKYDTLDRRILARTLGALSVASSGQRNESTVTIARSVGRLLESRRHMMKRVLEREIARAVVEHPGNAGQFKGEPNLVFSPRNVQLDSDAQTVQAIMALRTQNELSRESILEYFGFDQLTEALRRETEAASGLDATFQTRVPYSGSGPGGGDQSGQQSGQQGKPDEVPGEAPQVSGARGGRPVGGGNPPASVQGQVRKRSGNGNTTSKGDQ